LLQEAAKHQATVTPVKSQLDEVIPVATPMKGRP